MDELSIALDENVAEVTRVVIAGPSPEAVLLYSLAGGADAGLFAIDPVTGILIFLAPPDFENPADSDRDNIYDVVVRANDGTADFDQLLHVSVGDVDEAPVLADPGVLAVQENATAVTVLQASDDHDAVGAGLAFSITGGDDAARFVIDAATGALAFRDAPDYEAPADANHDNAYQVTVAVTDAAGHVSERALTVDVGDVDEAPVLADPGVLAVQENATAVTVLQASDDHDAVGAGLAFSITGGDDAARFVIDAATGALAFRDAPDYEAPADANHDNAYQVTVAVTDAAGHVSERALTVGVTDQKNLQIVISDGQSLSVGATVNPAILSTVPTYADKVLALDFGSPQLLARGWQTTPVDTNEYKGFTALREFGYETHSSSMLNRLITDYQAAGETAPTLLHISAGSGGRSILELMVSSSDIYDGLDQAVAATGVGAVFAVDNHDGTFAYYTKTETGLVSYGTRSDRPVFFDNLTTELSLAVGTAHDLGYEVSKDVLFNWIQGQADASLQTGPYGYGYLLGKLFDKVEAIFDAAIGGGGDVVGLVSQTRGFGQKPVALDQLQYVRDHANVGLGINEFAYQSKYPAVVGSDYTHLSSEGYYMIGQELGDKFFELLHGREIKPLLIDSTLQTSATTITVHFDGVKGGLVEDNSVFSLTNNLTPPANFGFTLYDAFGVRTNAIHVVNATITGFDTVELTLDGPVTSDLRLYLGRGESDPLVGGGLPSYGGDTLRDAAVGTATAAPSGAALADPGIYNFAPIQYVVLHAPTPPSWDSNGSFLVTENGTFVHDFNATDPISSEGAGLSYAIVGGDDASLFVIDAVTGALSFRDAPDYEHPADRLGDNFYSVTIRVTDALGAQSTLGVGVNVTNANEAPTGLTINHDNVSNNAFAGTLVGKVDAVDPDAGDRASFILTNDANGLFVIDAASGNITVANAALLAATEPGLVTVTVRATDAGGLSFEGDLQIQILGSDAYDYVGTARDDVASAGAISPWRAQGLGGNDKLTGGAGNDLLDGGEGNDLLDGGAGADHLIGDGGNDTVNYANSAAAVAVNLLTGATSGGDAAGDTLSGIENLIGSRFNDQLWGDTGDNILNGGLGNDLLNGGDGNDTASYADATAAVKVSLAVFTAQNTGGGGTDTLTSIENLIGSAFNDTLTGNALSNHLSGGAGVDTLDGGAGTDILEGGEGNDIYIVDNTGDQIIETATGGTADQVKSAVSFTLADFVEKLTLTGAANIDGTGNALANTLTGNTGNNILSGGGGKDILSGGAGDDVLIGGSGADTLTGGTGADRFVLNPVATSADKDTVKDFASGLDTIALDHLAFAAFVQDLPGALSDSAFAIGNAATNSNQHIIYNSSNGALYYDPDGVGGAAQVQIATITGHPALSAADFVLI